MSGYIIHDEYSKYPETQVKARAIGVRFYYTGRKCKNNHIAPRHTSSGNCVECVREKRNVTYTKTRSSFRAVNEENKKRAEEAIENGKTTYIPYEPCKNGHKERYVGTHNCVECNRISMAKRKHRVRWSRIEKEYGITESAFYEMLSFQKGKCKICNIEIDTNCHIDHSHKTGVVRGLLCSKCNQAIGLFNEDTDIMAAAIQYIKSHEA